MSSEHWQSRTATLPPKHIRRLPPSTIALIALAAGWPNLAAAEEQSGERGNRFKISTLSGQPDRVSGGNALVEIIVPRRERRVTIVLNGQDVTDSFRPGERSNSLVGLVSGLALGRNRLTVQGREHRRSLELTNYPIKGPIVSGPQIQPFICQTESFNLPDGTTLGPPVDADCSAETKVNYVYMSTDGTFRPLADPSKLPADLTQTTTTEGVTVNYIV